MASFWRIPSAKKTETVHLCREKDVCWWLTFESGILKDFVVEKRVFVRSYFSRHHYVKWVLRCGLTLFELRKKTRVEFEKWDESKKERVWLCEDDRVK